MSGDDVLVVGFIIEVSEQLSLKQRVEMYLRFFYADDCLLLDGGVRGEHDYL